MKLPRTSTVIPLLMAVSLIISSCALVPSPAPLAGYRSGIPGPVAAGDGLPQRSLGSARPGNECYTYADVFNDHEFWCMRGSKVVKFERGAAAVRDPYAADLDLSGFWQTALGILLFGDQQ